MFWISFWRWDPMSWLHQHSCQLDTSWAFAPGLGLCAPARLRLWQSLRKGTIGVASVSGTWWPYCRSAASGPSEAAISGEGFFIGTGKSFNPSSSILLWSPSITWSFDIVSSCKSYLWHQLDPCLWFACSWDLSLLGLVPIEVLDSIFFNSLAIFFDWLVIYHRLDV